MKTKKIVTLVLITFLLSFSQKGFAQDWKYWFASEKVQFYYKFIPAQGSTYPHYKLRVINRSGEYKSIYFYPVFTIGKKITGTSAKRNFFLKPGDGYDETFYINNQLKIQSGNKIPDLNLKEYSVKKY